MLGFIRRLLDQNAKKLKKVEAIVGQVNGLEPEISALSDEELVSETATFREQLERGATADDILPRAFAVVREVARRLLGERAYDVQVTGAVVLHRGGVAEMKTGEGKTLAATMPVYLNALSGQGVHVVTVNDYLARRDSEWMGQVYRFLGLEVGTIVPGLNYEQRREAYGCDITYGTNNEFGFDYLRDNMAVSPKQLVQRELHYAIVDEVDSVLIDEARTPLIISGVPRKSAGTYMKLARIARRLKPEEHYTVDEKAGTVLPTDEGIAQVEESLGIENLFDPENIEYSHSLNQALKAKELRKRDRDYVIQDGQVVIIDQFTGRMMAGRRYGDGLHQAIEAREGVEIREETQTLATITLQNYYRMYDKLAGMTGTAATEADELHEIYGLDVVVIPTNRPMVREDLPDAVYRSTEAKMQAVVEDIATRYGHEQPILVGTSSVESSEEVSDLLTRRGIPHEVLNAKHHEREADIVSGAGEKGRVTIATNMAGRGTDIVLGSGVTDLGGLHVLGTERHESRRVDNQLRGRSGRQGDPGSSQFYVAMEDDLMRLFGGETMESMMKRLGLADEERLEHPMLSRAIENAQRRVESRNFDMRKRLLEYDDVLNEQRSIIYEQRNRVLREADLREDILQMMDDAVQRRVETYAAEGRYPELWNLKGLVEDLEINLFPSGRVKVEDLLESAEEGGREGIVRHCSRLGRAVYKAKAERIGTKRMAEMERILLLRVVDAKWMDYLAAVDELRHGIGLRAYGQRDPLTEYRRETHHMFAELIQSIKEDTVKYLFKMQVSEGDSPGIIRRSVAADDVVAAAGHLPQRSPREIQGATGEAETQATPFRRNKPKVGRNDPCPCGSGKKYKHCCDRA